MALEVNGSVSWSLRPGVRYELTLTRGRGHYAATMHSDPFFYSAYGLTLASDIPLNLPRSTGAERRGPGIRFVAASWDFPHHDHQREWFEIIALSDGALLMRWQDLFAFVISAQGDRVEYSVHRRAPVEQLEMYLTTFAVAGALIQRGEEPLHATVVAKNRYSVGFIGASGVGKSTLAAFLMARGWSLVADDLLRLELGADSVMAIPGPGRLKLHSGPLRRIFPLPLSARQFRPIETVHAGDGLLVLRPAALFDCHIGPQPLSALYYLELVPRSAATPGPPSERLTGADLFDIVAACTHSQLYVAEQVRGYQSVARIVSGVPVYKLTYWHCYDLLDHVANLIERNSLL